MIDNIEAKCSNCKYWEYYETRNNGRILGTCKKSKGCICCHDEILFGSNGGGTFLSDESFLCKFHSDKKEENAQSN